MVKELYNSIFSLFSDSVSKTSLILSLAFLLSILLFDSFPRSSYETKDVQSFFEGQCPFQMGDEPFILLFVPWFTRIITFSRVVTFSTSTHTEFTICQALFQAFYSYKST